MKKVFNLLVFLIIPLLVKSSETTTNVSTSLESNDIECGDDCDRKVESKKLSELQDKIRDQEETIKSLKDTIAKKGQQLTQQTELSDSYKSHVASNNNLIATLQFMVKSKDSEINEKQTQIKSLRAQQMQNELNVVKMKQLDLKFAECKAHSIAQICEGKTTDIHEIKVPDMDPFSIPCDVDTPGNSWMLIQRRMDGSVDFNRTWVEYKEGFGNLSSEFFIGLEKLHLITKSQPHILFIYMEDFRNETRYAKYSHFLIGNETESYALKMLGHYSGDANNSLQPHLNKKFATPDRDTEENCAKTFESGWWYTDCAFCNLNEPYTSEDVGFNGKKISWHGWHELPIRFTQMMIRPTLS